jgi:DNA-binding transcriptional regulator LsrR (DeoR family)
MPTSPLLLVKICHAYYRDHLTMAEVGARFSLSRHKVSRMLQEAEEVGVVRIDIRSPSGQASNVERAVEAGLGIKTCVIASVERNLAPEEIKRRTCAVGAEFLREIIQDNGAIGIGWGSTTFELVNQFEPSNLPGAQVIQITGGNKRISHLFDCQEVTRRLAEKLGTTPLLLHAPGIVDRKETRDLLLGESSIADIIKLFPILDMAIVGIGSLVPAEASMLLSSGYVGVPEQAALKRAGAVGDVFSYFVNAAGDVVKTELYDRLIAIGLDDLKRIPTRIGVATGPIKAKAVVAAARGGFVNTVILDSLLAGAVLAEIGAPLPPTGLEVASGERV